MDWVPRHVRFAVSVSVDGVVHPPGFTMEVGEQMDVAMAIRLLRAGSVSAASDARYQGSVPDLVEDVVDSAVRPRPAAVRESKARSAGPAPARYAPPTSERRQEAALWEGRALPDGYSVESTDGGWHRPEYMGQPITNKNVRSADVWPAIEAHWEVGDDDSG